MLQPILATKLYIPQLRSKAVSRPRLTRQLEQGTDCKLTLICAPAGFGKTTLVSDWIADASSKTAWLSLDQGDSELSRFLTYFVAALQTVDKSIGEHVLGQLKSPQLPSESLLMHLLNDIAAHSSDLLLVLDDYHLIDAQAVDDALGFLLEHGPPNFHLLMTTREDPQLPLPRLRVRGQLTELRASDLRFTLEEATQFLNESMGLSVSAEDISCLDSRTEGWIAGLQMVALSVRGRTDISEFIASFSGSHRFIFDYLAAEVLQQQPKSVQHFLLQTSILERLSGPLCNAVTQCEDAEAMLERLEQANLFVIPLDDHREWYRYHHLFADILKARLLKEHPEQLAELHARASFWFEQNDLTLEAIRHALAAEDFERAAALLELAFPIMDRTFQIGTWFSWVEALPEALFRARPVLSVHYAMTLLYRGELEASDIRLQDAERWLDAMNNQDEISKRSLAKMVVVDEEQFRSLAALVANTRAFHAQSSGDLAGTVTYTQQALDLLPEEDHYGRGTSSAIMGLAQWANGDLEAAYLSIAHAMAGFQKAGHGLVALSGIASMADIKIAQGRLREAIDVYEQALQLAAKEDEPAIKGMANLYLGLSELHYEQGNLEAANKYLQKSEALGEPAGFQDWHYRLCLARAQVKQNFGDLDSALNLLDKAAALYHETPTPRPDVRPVAALKTQLWIAQGKLVDALGWVSDQNLSADDELSYLHEFEHLTLARLGIAQYKNDHNENLFQETMGLLARLHKAAAEGQRTGSVIDILIQQSLAYQVQTDMTAALKALQQALRLAEPEGYVQTFTREGVAMQQLLTHAKAMGVQVSYVTNLLAAYEEQKKPVDNLLEIANQALAEPLTARELEVLQLLAEGFSNRDISKRLYRALDTVKGYNRNIFGKLQVQNRAEAVTKARELNLIQN